VRGMNTSSQNHSPSESVILPMDRSLTSLQNPINIAHLLCIAIVRHAGAMKLSHLTFVLVFFASHVFGTTTFTLKCTIPLETVNFIASPTTRGTWDIFGLVFSQF
jgi:hypothetical protein